MIAYDRIGYNYKDNYETQASITFETAMLKDVTKNIPKEQLIIVGYSYGGPIALAFKEKIKKIVLLAPALYGKLEVIPWVVNFYNWKVTQWLVPAIWKQASKEKITHEEDLDSFENEWQNTQNNVISIHGQQDWLVPYENSTILESVCSKDKFELISIENASHALVWTNFELIKKQLLIVLD